MLKLEQVKRRPEESEDCLREKAASLLRIPPEEILSLTILRRAVDARPPICLVYTLAVEVKNEGAVLRRSRCRQASPYLPQRYTFTGTESAPNWHQTAPNVLPPVVVGAGPAGLFATLLLARAGLRPILLERGQPVEQRQKDVENFWSGGPLLPNSNVQFGEGGAGAFSDGKLNTGTKDPRHRFILEELVSCGAPESILVDAKPHVGTDMLHIALKNMRKKLLSLGADIRFCHRLEGVETRQGQLTGITVAHGEEIYALPVRNLILALGHSARDTVERLYGQGLFMEAKPFAVGVRIEHLQSRMDAVQYKEYAGHPALPVSSYKLSCHLPDGRGVFSFCVCPGGQVVAAASEPRRTVTNGMSEYARSGENINGGLLVGVSPRDFGSDHPLAGIAFQRRLEEAAYRLGGGFTAPCQRVEDFLHHRPSTGCASVRPSYRPGVRYADLHDCLPDFIAGALEQALPLLDKKLPGFADGDALLTAVESRSSAPVRIPRNEDYESNITGLYPCGEGAGYAGGILSAAADGMRCAEKILAKNL